ncbi:MAG: HEAT repeat domain-containing protein [Phycisphaerales bacterium]
MTKRHSTFTALLKLKHGMTPSSAADRGRCRVIPKSLLFVLIVALTAWRGATAAQTPVSGGEPGRAAPASPERAAPVSGGVSDDPMAADVLFTVPVVPPIIEPAQIEALVKAAGQPDEETRLQVLQAVSEHHFTQLADAVKALLNDDRPLVRTAAAQTAEQLKLTDTAATMRPWLTSVEPKSTERINLLLAVDHALATFGDRESEAAWVARVRGPHVPAVLRVSALRALADTHVGFPSEVIAAATDPSQPAEVRLAAADVIATFGHLVGFNRSGELFAPYDKLLAGSLIDRLVAARMLTGEGVPAAVPLLRRAAADGEPAVQAIALTELKTRGPDALTLTIIEASLKSDDPKVRLFAVEGLPLHGVSRSVELAMARLSDDHPLNRAAARASLLSLAQTPALDQQIRQAMRRELAADDAVRLPWGRAEQLTLLARDLDDKSSAESLTKLLRHDRVEVVVAAVKALRRLDVASTHAAVLSLLQNMIGLMEDKQPVNDPQREICRQAAMTLGVWRTADADATLRRAIPKEHPMGGARSAAVWALGLIHEGRYDATLAGPLIGRINDTAGMMPESEDVRLAGVVALGRMKSEQSLDILRKYRETNQDTDSIRYAAWWAVGHITGQAAPPPTVQPGRVRVQFLSPVR